MKSASNLERVLTAGEFAVTGELGPERFSALVFYKSEGAGTVDTSLLRVFLRAVYKQHQRVRGISSVDPASFVVYIYICIYLFFKLIELYKR